MVSIAPIPQSKSRVKKLDAHPPLLYPKYDLTKPNHGAKAVYKPEHKLDHISDSKSQVSYASTAPTSTLSKVSVTIAPLPY